MHLAKLQVQRGGGGAAVGELCLEEGMEKRRRDGEVNAHVSHQLASTFFYTDLLHLCALSVHSTAGG